MSKATYTYDENGLRLTKTIDDTTHEYFYNNEVLDSINGFGYSKFN